MRRAGELREAQPRATARGSPKENFFGAALALLVGSMALLASSAALVGCGSSGGGGSSAAASVQAPPSVNGVGPAGGQSAAQWRTALAALGTSYTPAAPTFEDASLARWNAVIAQGWFQTRSEIEPTLKGYLQTALANVGSGVVLQNVRDLTLDTSAPPAFSSGASAGLPDRLIATAPGSGPGWSAQVTADVTWTPSFHIAGIPVATALSFDVTVRVDSLRVVDSVDFDVTDPARPVIKGTGTPAVNFNITVTSTSTMPFIQQILGAITTVLDPVVRTALTAGSGDLQTMIANAVAALPTSPYGLGGPGITALTTTADLEALSVGVSDEIQLHHIPFATNVWPVVFDQAGYGNGNPVGYTDVGDTAIWTGHYIAAEAVRYGETGDPRALAGAKVALDGITADLDIGGPGSGLLARCAVPTSSPFVGMVSGWGAYYTGVHDGIPMGGLGYISRDQYLGATLGSIEAFLRVPPLQSPAHDNIVRICRYLAQNDWGAYDHNSPACTAPFSMNPDALWALLKCANTVDRTEWGAMHDVNEPLAGIVWFPIWVSSREVHDGYYKFNLMHSTMAMLVATETDPVLYREYVKGLEVMHDAVGHHMNAWFDVVYGQAVPTAAAAIGPLVENELQHWALRPRRSFSLANSADPTVAKTYYTPASVGGGQPNWVANYPLPIEKRASGDFLWQTDPFQLDCGGDGKTQYPGIDLILPYWMGRSFGFFK